MLHGSGMKSFVHPCSILVFNRVISDYYLFVRSENNYIVILLVYVDNIILTGNSEFEIDKVQNFLKSLFLIRDLGN